MTTTYQITLDINRLGEDNNEYHDTYTLTFQTKEGADAAIPLLKSAIKQGARCGKVNISPDGDWDPEEVWSPEQVKEAVRVEAVWDRLDLPDWIWITGVKSYQRVSTEDLLA